MYEKNSQTEANKRWQEKNKEHAKYLSNRSRTRSFIKKQATLEDIKELQVLIDDRINELVRLSEQEQKVYEQWIHSHVNNGDLHDFSIKTILSGFGIEFNEKNFPFLNNINIASFKTEAGNILQFTYSKPISSEFFLFLKELNLQIASK